MICQLFLSKGGFTTLDEEDYQKASKYLWYAHKDNKTGIVYANRNQKIGRGKQRSLRLHRFILGLKPGDGTFVDHRDRNGLNNTRSNLRICTNAENCRNQPTRKNNTSGFKGVSFKKGKWIARIGINYKRIHLGYFTAPEEAHSAYCKAATIYHKEFSRTK